MIADLITLVFQFTERGLHDPQYEDHNEADACTQLHDVKERWFHQFAIFCHFLKLLKLTFHDDTFDVKSCNSVPQKPLLEDVLTAHLDSLLFEEFSPFSQCEQVSKHDLLLKLEL